MGEHLIGKSGCNIFHLNNDIIVILFNFKDMVCSGEEDLFLLMDKIKSRLLEHKSIDVAIGVGEVCRGIENIRKSYNQALNALRYKSLMGGDLIYSLRDFESQANFAEIGVDADEAGILIKTGEAQRLLENINGDFDALRRAENKSDIYSVYLLCSRYVCSFVRVIKEYGISTEDIFGGGSNPFADYIGMKSIEKMKEWIVLTMYRIADQIYSIRNEKNAALVQNIKKYVDAYYASEINNTSRADVMQLSPNYMGCIFKRETGISINEYINKVRITEARRLLKETNLMVYEVAYRVGFNDQHYFSSVFKRVVGVAPKEYKEIPSVSQDMKKRVSVNQDRHTF